MPINPNQEKIIALQFEMSVNLTYVTTLSFRSAEPSDGIKLHQ